jgi:hypothetical protein
MTISPLAGKPAPKEMLVDVMRAPSSTSICPHHGRGLSLVAEHASARLATKMAMPLLTAFSLTSSRVTSMPFVAQARHEPITERTPNAVGSRS